MLSFWPAAPPVSDEALMGSRSVAVVRRVSVGVQSEAAGAKRERERDGVESFGCMRPAEKNGQPRLAAQDEIDAERKGHLR